MRLPSAFGALTVATLAAACSIPVAPQPRPEPAIAALKDVGVEGKTYYADLGADRVFKVGNVWNVADDLLIEDIHGGLIYLDGATLTPRWAYFGLGAPFDRAPDFTETTVVGVAKGRVHVISRRNGLDVIEPARVSVVPSAGVVANDTTMYIPTFRTPNGNRTVQSVNLADGYEGWGWRTDTDIVADLAKAGLHGGDMFYAAAEDGTVYGFPMYVATARDYEPSWATSLRSGVRGHRRLAVAGDDLAVVTDDHRLVMMDRITGNVRWEAYPNSGDRATSAAQLSAKHAFYAVAGELRAFDRASGARVWSVKGATRFVAERGARTLLTDADGNLIAVETKTGNVLGRKPMKGWRLPTRTTPDATVIAINNGGVVVAVETGW